MWDCTLAVLDSTRHGLGMLDDSRNIVRQVRGRGEEAWEPYLGRGPACMRSKISLAVGRSKGLARMHSLMSAAMPAGHCSGACTTTTRDRISAALPAVCTASLSALQLAMALHVYASAQRLECSRGSGGRRRAGGYNVWQERVAVRERPEVGRCVGADRPSSHLRRPQSASVRQGAGADLPQDHPEAACRHMLQWAPQRGQPWPDLMGAS